MIVRTACEVRCCHAPLRFFASQLDLAQCHSTTVHLGLLFRMILECSRRRLPSILQLEKDERFEIQGSGLLSDVLIQCSSCSRQTGPMYTATCWMQNLSRSQGAFAPCQGFCICYSQHLSPPSAQLTAMLIGF